MVVREVDDRDLDLHRLEQPEVDEHQLHQSQVDWDGLDGHGVDRLRLEQVQTAGAY